MRRPTIIAKIKEALSIAAPSAKTIIYGSEARGDARPDSDIDLLVLLPGENLSYEEEKRIFTPLYKIELETGVLISPRIMLEKIWNNAILTPFKQNVINEGIPL